MSIGQNQPTIKCFVSMPFSSQFDRVFVSGICGVADFLLESRVDLIRLDKEAYHDRHLENNVLKHIDECDLLIADMSSADQILSPNPSVMYEIGYAIAGDISCILIGKVGSYANLPANLKGSILIEYDLDADSDLKDFSRRLSRQIDKTIKEKVIRRIKGRFQAECFAQGHQAPLAASISASRNRVQILTTNLEYVSTHLKNAFDTALKANEANPGFKIRILTIDPECNIAQSRAQQLGKNLRNYRDTLRRSLDSMIEAYKDDSRVELKTYKTLPTQISFLVDDSVFQSVVSLGQEHLDGTMFVSNDSGIIESFLSHFKALEALSWKNS